MQNQFYLRSKQTEQDTVFAQKTKCRNPWFLPLPIMSHHILCGRPIYPIQSDWGTPIDFRPSSAGRGWYRGNAERKWGKVSHDLAFGTFDNTKFDRVKKRRYISSSCGRETDWSMRNSDEQGIMVKRVLLCVKRHLSLTFVKLWPWTWTRGCTSVLKHWMMACC